MTIIKRMKQAIEGPSDTVRLMTLSIKQHGDTLVEWKMAHVTGTADGALDADCGAGAAPREGDGLSEQRRAQRNLRRQVYIPPGNETCARV